jgi:uncharacterized membrane protein YhhN
MRDGDRWSTRSQRNTELWLLVAVWLGFAQAYVPRLFQSPLFTALGVVLLASNVWFVSRALREEVSRQITQSAGR